MPTTVAPSPPAVAGVLTQALRLAASTASDRDGVGQLLALAHGRVTPLAEAGARIHTVPTTDPAVSQRATRLLAAAEQAARTHPANHRRVS